jgi:uncharacterized membrane protein
MATAAPQTPSGPRFLESGRGTPGGNGVNWISAAWGLFTQAPGMWILFTILLFVIAFVINFIPLGGIAFQLLSPVFGGGILLGCAALRQGKPLELSQLFAGFSHRAGPLLLVGLLYMVGAVVITVITAIVVVAGFGGAGLLAALKGGNFDLASGIAGMVSLILIGALIFLALLVPLMMAYWFAPVLVVFHDFDALRAMQASFSACLKNIVPFLLYGVVMFVLAIVASIPLFLGWLALAPVIMASVYTSYEDIFFER